VYFIINKKIMKKCSVMALLGATQAATPGPTPTATFPKFDTVVPPAASFKETNFVKSTYSMSGTVLSGLYRAYRNDLIIFPTQSLTVGNTATAQAVVAQTVTRTFYQHKAQQIGNYPVKTTATYTNVATGPTYVACLNTNVAAN